MTCRPPSRLLAPHFLTYSATCWQTCLLSGTLTAEHLLSASALPALLNPAGPDVVDLTIIDLPGIVHSMGNQVSSEEGERYKALVQATVEEYMARQQAIIVTVLTCKDDPNNQVRIPYGAQCTRAGPQAVHAGAWLARPMQPTA